MLKRLYSWYGKRNVIITLIVIIILAIAGFIVHGMTKNSEVEEAKETLSVVTLSRADELNGASSFRVVGTVKAVSEARLQAETGGRITNVSVALGDTVRAGAILASVENSAQRAALLQAEGAYDAAVAGAASSQSSAQSAEADLESTLISAASAYKSAFINADSSVRNTIDDLFSNPTGNIPGLKLQAYGQAPALNAERTALEAVLDTWSADLAVVNSSNVETKLIEARNDTERIARFAETLAELASRQETDASFSQAQKDALEAELLAVRATLNQTAQALASAASAIETAQAALERAQIAGSNNTASLSEAQLKSALGSLRAAQSAYEKTLVRTPISGVVNALYVKAGEYAIPGAPAAIIANNGALEISTALSAEDAEMITVGQEVTLDQNATGVVTAIAPAIDPLTGKKEVKIGVNEDVALTNGSTVSVEFSRNEQWNEDTGLTIPLSALKMTAEGSIAFTVSDNTLVAHKVEIGKIKGDTVEVVSGLAPDMVIVTDARGLREGEKVEVTQE
jgi:membrane fusion protein, multidrug efflux system